METLQQFSPAYPLQPIYRPVVYNHGSLSYFKENDVGALRTATNVNDEAGDKGIKNTKNNTDHINSAEKVEKSKSNIPLVQVPKAEQQEMVSSATAKSQVTEASKLPIPMDKVLAVKTVNATARLI